jgi:hypothetical protein
VNHSRHKFIVYILYGVCIQTSVSIFVSRRDLVQMKRLKCVVSGGVAYLNKKSMADSSTAIKTGEKKLYEMNFLIYGPSASRQFRFITNFEQTNADQGTTIWLNLTTRTGLKRANASGHQLPRNYKFIYRLLNCTC